MQLDKRIKSEDAKLSLFPDMIVYLVEAKVSTNKIIRGNFNMLSDEFTRNGGLFPKYKK